jgi:hypothetical protein
VKKRLAILQSNYVPWKGYFDLINMVDEFVIYDSVQYTKNDWRNRNLIKTNNGVQWLTIPCYHKLDQRIKDTKVSQRDWGIRHWNTVSQFYNKTPYFKEYRDIFADVYHNTLTPYLSEINWVFITTINAILGVETKLIDSSDFVLQGDKTERLMNICKERGVDVYVSGPAAKSYLDIAMMNNAGIEVEWVDYSGYPEYNQLFPPFCHNVSVLDLIFNTGIDATKYMKSYALQSV